MEQLTKGEFIELDIEKKIQYLNDRLSQGQTVIRIREDLGIGEKTLQKIMKENGYKYNQKERLYKKSTDVEKIVSSSEKSPDKEIYKSSIPVERHTNGSNPEVESKIYNSREIVVDKEKFNLMLKSYKKVEQMAEKLDAVYRWYEKEHEVIDVTPKELKIDKFEGEAVSRAYKFYPDIQKDFIEFCDKHKQYKKQDIICQALKEFMEKYKNSKG
ncbi:hypothetical protein [Paraclostridium tenue]|uniref:DNA-binding protein n=1 Tax=Paraclostridium tenue TaxID=1737 RepID=A0ABN1MB79_9FIRM